MENNHQDLINEINELKKELRNKHELILKYHYKIYETKKFINHYENSLQKKDKYKNDKNSSYFELTIILLSNLCYTYYAFNINSPTGELAQLISGGLLALSAFTSGFIVSDISKNNKKLNNLKYELSENRARYKAEKNNLKVYNQEQDELSKYTEYNLEPRLQEKKLALFHLNETNPENIKPFINNLYPDPFVYESFNELKLNKTKKLIKIKK